MHYTQKTLENVVDKKEEHTLIIENDSLGIEL